VRTPNDTRPPSRRKATFRCRKIETDLVARNAARPKEQIGSGPFKFVQAEFQPGVKAVYGKNKDYVPLKEPPIIGFRVARPLTP
jgi:ABC-type transport system substrate-binding protein